VNFNQEIPAACMKETITAYPYFGWKTSKVAIQKENIKIDLKRNGGSKT
jgi:hypothetical protein